MTAIREKLAVTAAPTTPCPPALTSRAVTAEAGVAKGDRMSCEPRDGERFRGGHLLPRRRVTRLPGDSACQRSGR